MNFIEAVGKAKEKYDSFYLYDEHVIAEQIAQLKTHFPTVYFLYSVKCNSNRNILQSVFRRGFGADAASLEEVCRASENGLTKEEIYFSAPGKSRLDIEESFQQAILIADSITEIDLMEEIAANKGITVDIGIRINPDFSFTRDVGYPSKFGIDEQQVYRLFENNNFSHVNIIGIHVHIKSQELDAGRLKNYYKKVLALAENFQKKYDMHFKFINMGSGMGIPYAEDELPLNVASLGNVVEAMIQSYNSTYPETKIMIETGRFVVGKGGFYITKVMDKKESYGKTFLILKNTLNGFLRPSLARLVQKYATIEKPMPSEPLFTCLNEFQINTLIKNRPLQKVTLVGNLCTATDVIAEDIELPILLPGEVIIITNAGCYGAVLSPMQFSNQDKPEELFITIEGQITKI